MIVSSLDEVGNFKYIYSCTFPVASDEPLITDEMIAALDKVFDGVALRHRCALTEFGNKNGFALYAVFRTNEITKIEFLQNMVAEAAGVSTMIILKKWPEIREKLKDGRLWQEQVSVEQVMIDRGGK